MNLMESQRSLLFIALMVVTYLLFSQWQLENAPAVEQPTTSQSNTLEQTAGADFVPEPTDSSTPIATSSFLTASALASDNSRLCCASPTSSV